MKKVLGWIATLLAVAVAAAIGRSLANEGMEIIFNKTSTPNIPFPKSSPLHDPYKIFIKKLLNSPEYIESLKKVKNKEEAFEFGFSLSQQGLSKLDDASLEKRVIILKLVLERMPEKICAEMIRKNSSSPQLFSKAIIEALEELEPEYIQGWFDISFNASIAQLRGSPNPVLHADASEAAMADLIRLLPATEQGYLVKVLTNLNKVSDADACNAGKLIYKTIPNLPKPSRALLARALVAS